MHPRGDHTACRFLHTTFPSLHPTLTNKNPMRAAEPTMPFPVRSRGSPAGASEGLSSVTEICEEKAARAMGTRATPASNSVR
jgi:hypothetical protein